MYNLAIERKHNSSPQLRLDSHPLYKHNTIDGDVEVYTRRIKVILNDFDAVFHKKVKRTARTQNVEQMIEQQENNKR